MKPQMMILDKLTVGGMGLGYKCPYCKTDMSFMRVWRESKCICNVTLRLADRVELQVYALDDLGVNYAKSFVDNSASAEISKVLDMEFEELLFGSIQDASTEDGLPYFNTKNGLPVYDKETKIALVDAMLERLQNVHARLQLEKD